MLGLYCLYFLIVGHGPLLWALWRSRCYRAGFGSWLAEVHRATFESEIRVRAVAWCLGGDPRGSKHPIFEVSDPKSHEGYVFWDQRP